VCVLGVLCSVVCLYCARLLCVVCVCWELSRVRGLGGKLFTIRKKILYAVGLFASVFAVIFTIIVIVYSTLVTSEL